MVEKRYWPFEVPPEQELVAEDKRVFAFLDAAHREGFNSFDCEGMLLGATARNGREGDLVRRGGKGRYWEAVFAESGQIVACLYIDGFEPASNAVLRWLQGDSYDDIRAQLGQLVVSKPGGPPVAP